MRESTQVICPTGSFVDYAGVFSPSFRGARSASFDVQLHIRESILPIVVMDSGPAPSGASRNDGSYKAASFVRARTNGRCACDKITRRANQQKPVQPSCEKYSAFAVGQISDLNPPVSPDERGGSRSSRTCGGMRWTRMCRRRTARDAYGEVVWSCAGHAQ